MKYVECDYCGKHIHEGDKCYSSKELDDSLIENCGREFKEE